MLELYQFELSHYCEKVRLILDYKGLAYRKIEVTPGIGQIDVYRLSGQRQVPVLKDGTTVIADSTAIARYLEQRYPERSLLPSDPKQLALCWLLEEWADEALGLNARKILLGTFSQNQSFRTAVLPTFMPPIVKNLVGAVPSELLGILGTGVGVGPDVIKSAKEALEQALTSLCALLSNQPYLLGSQPTLADLTVAGLSMYLKFPTSTYVDLPDNLAGRSVPGLADNPLYQPFFDWRDRLYQDYRNPLTSSRGSDSGTSGSSPTPINID